MSRSGFTLVEVLVVLAILVILFGLLFAPMMAGMDMVTQGRIQARLQDTARATAEQVRRDLVNAMYVYPPPAYQIADGTVVTDYSEIVFVPPETDSAGDILTPRRPRTWTDPVTGAREYLVERYWVKPPDVSGGRAYDEGNPFVLMRQEGLYRWDDAVGRYVFGSVDPDVAGAPFVPGRALSENSMTPREDYDIPATTTICLDDGQMEVGYVDKCPSDGSTNLVYLHDDVKFQPERIVGEPLQAQQDNTLYVARHGNWMGTPFNGAVRLSASALSRADSELQPRIVAYRWDSTDDAYTRIVLDTFGTTRSNMTLVPNSANGSVQVGEWHTARVSVNVAGMPGAAQYWPLTITSQAHDEATARTDTYDFSGALSGTQTTPLVPIYPKTPTEWGEPRMPIGYRIDPAHSDGSGAAAKLVPGSVRVTVVGATATDNKRAMYVPVQEINQSELGTFEFSEFLPVSRIWGEVRFSRVDPPSPDQMLSGLTGYDIYISYYYRRNFDDADPYRDDVLYADYSTGEIINITLIPQRYVDLVPYPNPTDNNIDNLVVPPDLPVGGVPVRTQAVVLNARH